MKREISLVEVDHLLEMEMDGKDYEVLVRLELEVFPSRDVEDGHPIQGIKLLAIQDVYDLEDDKSFEDIPDHIRSAIEKEVDDLEPEDVEDNLPEPRIN